MKRILLELLILMSLTLLLTGCAGEQTNEPITPVIEPISNEDEQTIEELVVEPVVEPVVEEESSENPMMEESTGRQDGERFDGVIMLEGMEETVHYEHIINDVIGFELDYEYETFVRRKEADREYFISVYDDINQPENYLEVTYSQDDFETAATVIAETLSNDYDISRSEVTLDCAGSCIKFDASIDKNGETPDNLQTVYVIPVKDGCLVARAKYSFESAEGFGKRVSSMVNTLMVK